VSHAVQAIVGTKRTLDAIQHRFGVSRVVHLSERLCLLPMLDEFYDVLPGVDGSSVVVGQFHFRYLSPKVLQLLTDASRSEAIAYFETDYFGGAGDQGAMVAKDGKVVFGPMAGSHAINSALQILGVMKEGAQDEFEALGLSRFRRNEDWIDQPT